MKIDDDYAIEPLELEGPDFEQRLSELTPLKTGWLGGGYGQAIVSDEIDRMREVLELMVWDFGFVAPHIYPTERGGVRAEWSNGDLEVSLETKPSGQYDLHALDVRTDEEQERVDVVDHRDVLRFLRGFVRQNPVLDDVYPEKAWVTDED
jgi:hypothetical protein